MTYIVQHLILQTDVLRFEEFFQRLLLLAARSRSVPGTSKVKGLHSDYLPIDIAELVLAQSTLQSHGDVKRATGRHRTTHPRHGDHRDILELHVGRRLGYEDETLVQKVKQSFVRLDRALDAAVAVMTASR